MDQKQKLLAAGAAALLTAGIAVGLCLRSRKNGAAADEEKKGEDENLVDKYIRYDDAICANDFVNPTHDALYRDSIDNQADFFDREAKLLHWFQPYTTIIDTSD